MTETAEKAVVSDQVVLVTAPASAVPCVPSSMMNKILALGICAGMVIFIGGVVLALGESAENKLKFYQAMTFPFSVIVAATLAALGFANGKLLENVVPAGYLPALKAVATAAAVNAGIPASIIAPLLNSGKTEEKTTTSTTTTKVISLVPFAVAMMFVGGCVNTSEPFKASIGAGVNNTVLDMRDYTANNDWDKNHNGVIDADEAAEKAKQSANTDLLAQSITDRSKITLDGVSVPWQSVEPVYRKYIDGDRTLITIEDKKIRTDTPDAINRLIDLERQRQSSLWAKLGVAQ